MSILLDPPVGALLSSFLPAQEPNNSPFLIFSPTYQQFSNKQGGQCKKRQWREGRGDSYCSTLREGRWVLKRGQGIREPKIAKKKEEEGLTTLLLPVFPPLSFLSLAKGKWRQIGGSLLFIFLPPPFRAIKLSGSGIRQSVPFLCALYRHHYIPDGDFPSNFSSLHLYVCVHKLFLHF